MTKRLFTIGYEAAALSDFIATLVESGVRTVIDIRELPISRRPGFAKRALGEAVTAAGMTYIHLKALGDPKEGRNAAHAGDMAGFRRIFKAHLKTTPAQEALAVAIDIADTSNSCLLCYERDPQVCHRLIVAAEMARTGEFAIQHLGVRQGLGCKTDRHDRRGSVEYALG